jgi:hypothetical protein
VQPQVWHGVRTASGENSVLYEVKFNYDYYNYVSTQSLYIDARKNARRLNSGSNQHQYHQNQMQSAISLPWRLPPPEVNSSSGMYDVTKCAANPSQNGYPCQAGAVQIKAAWRRITKTERSSFHWTPGIYYRSTGGEKVCQAVGDFGLIGLHIIQKTFYQGHYIYATWEHKSVSTDLYTYAEHPVQPANMPAKPLVPAFPGGTTVTRAHSILPSTVKTDVAYHNLIRAANPSSVWLNYQLIGVQYMPVECWASGNQPCAPSGFQVGLEDPANNGQPFYLANLVIETNWGLQNFQGVPPGPPGPYNPVAGFATSPSGTKARDHYVPNTTGTFNRSLGNVGQARKARGQVFNMGGCMGCHGVATSLGTDFSFALFLGQKGAVPEAANHEQPVGPLSYGNDVSIRNNSPNFGTNTFLGIRGGNQIIVTNGPADQQFVLVNPGNPSSLVPLGNGSVVAIRSTTGGGYLVATNTKAPPTNNTWYQVQLAPNFNSPAARWTIQTVSGSSSLNPGQVFCLASGLVVNNDQVFLSQYQAKSGGPVSAGVIRYCSTNQTSWEHWALQRPFAPPN